MQSLKCCDTWILFKYLTRCTTTQKQVPKALQSLGHRGSKISWIQNEHSKHDSKKRIPYKAGKRLQKPKVQWFSQVQSRMNWVTPTVAPGDRPTSSSHGYPYVYCLDASLIPLFWKRIIRYWSAAQLASIWSPLLVTFHICGFSGDSSTLFCCQVWRLSSVFFYQTASFVDHMLYSIVLFEYAEQLPFISTSVLFLWAQDLIRSHTFSFLFPGIWDTICTPAYLNVQTAVVMTGPANVS